ncbi:RNA-binding (RRM/RBD/RNP motifs) family protein [Actinidia rufa]|uniref:RNA-binding (RRM/RBD/RNP motifs) family protein n=1 Tax=Actinidia rufa TaxID=165716 RepID=A0A7J0E7S0_9ERIC|nr:RNA-binding (RRM/RBD/RNP motifs) family protein [Actinidia rufa]
MDSDQGKLFIGGISWETNEDRLKDYFGNYGEVMQTVIMRDKISGKPRGFGFVVFADPSVLDRVLQDKHVLDGRTVEAKRALSREEQQTSSRTGNTNNARNFGSGGNYRTKKIFVGGLPPTLSEEEFRQYFEAYGNVTDVVVMYDQQTQRPRGFGFISFDSEDAVDRVLHKTFHDLNGKQVEVKRALPKDANLGGGGGGRSMGGGASSGGGGAGGGSYQGYGGSGGNSGSYDGRVDSSRYMQSQNTGGGFAPFGSSGYNAPGYGYGPASNSMGYSSYGSYGGPASAGYGNPNAPSAGYGSGPPGAARSSWNSQAPSGYGAVGYQNAAPWGAPNASGGGPGSAHPQVNLPVGLLGMETKIMPVAILTGFMATKLRMVLLEVVLGVSQIAMLLLVGASCKAVVGAIWEVAMVIPMGIQGMEVKDGDLILLKLLEVTEVREMDLMAGQLVTVVGTVAPLLDRLNSSDLDDLILFRTLVFL